MRKGSALLVWTNKCNPPVPTEGYREDRGKLSLDMQRDDAS